MTRSSLAHVAAALLALSPFANSARADDPKPDVKDCIERGLKFLVDTQNRDGRWEANGGQYPTTMTAISGMALLMEGSTLRDGKYSDNIRRAVDWFMERSQPNGLLGNPNNPTEASRYMYGHGFGLLFLASVYGEEEDADRRKKLEKILTKAVDFCGKAQTNRGGWGYVSAADGSNFDEGSVTITQLQGIRAARNAGIVVPKSILDNAVKYLKDCTTPNGGIIYSLAHGGAVNGGERPALTAAAVACAFSAGEYNSEYAKRWIKYCKHSIPTGRGRVGHDEYQSYYFSQAVYVLGETGYAKMFPDEKNKNDHLTWSKYRDSMFEYLKSSQNKDGSWTSGYIGPSFTTAVNLTILQLENNVLPIYQK
jgi:hypothetical protein